jgi:hypothetical protein
MNKKDLLVVAAVVVVCSIVGGFVGAKVFAPQLAGDFPGGITPNNLLQANVSNGGLTPVGSLSFGFGGTAPANQIVTLVTTDVNYPTSTNVNLGPLVSSTSTATTSVAFSASGLSVGDACEVSYNGATTTGAFGADSFVTAVSGSNVTATVTFWNGGAAAIALTPTSSATGISSTLKTTCFHTGV